MSKFQEAIDKYHKMMTEKMGMKNVDADLLRAATKACGPSIYNNDSNKVSSSDEKELDRVRQNFIKKKLEINDEEKAENAIKAVVEKFQGSRTKYRAIFYYLLAQELDSTDKLM